MKGSEWIKLLVFSMLGIGGWAQTLVHWSDAITPGAVSGLLIILASLIGMAFGVNTNGVAAAIATKITGNGKQPTPKEQIGWPGKTRTQADNLLL